MLLLPWVGWLPLTTWDPVLAVTQSPMFLLAVLFVGLLAAWIGTRDAWLGLLIGWLAIGVLAHPSLFAFETAELTAFGAVGVVLMRQLPVHRRPQVQRLLVLGGIAQVLYGIAQWFGYDLFWAGTGQIRPMAAQMGTLGNSNYYGDYLAILTPLAPVWLLPIFALGLLLSKSVLAITAAMIGVVMVRRALLPWAGLLGGLGLAYLLATRPEWYHSVMVRLEVWQLALSHGVWWQWLIGHGPGSWYEQVPLWQFTANPNIDAVFRQAHNEVLQLFFESGAMALVCVAGWFWRHRAFVQNPYGGSVAALFITCLGMFPLHLAIVALTAIVVLGLATTEESHDTMAER